MTAKEMVTMYYITKVTDGPNAGALSVGSMPTNPERKAELMAAVPEIKKYFAELEETKARRERNVESIAGLQEIQDLRNAMEDYSYRFNKSFEGEFAVGGMGVGKRPEGNEAELLAKYPQAAAYLRVRRQADKTNYELGAIGRRALARFEDAPDEWETVIADMEKELKEKTEQHLWD